MCESVNSDVAKQKFDDFVDALNRYMLESLEKAYANNEVQGQDQVQVSALWQRLFVEADVLA